MRRDIALLTLEAAEEYGTPHEIDIFKAYVEQGRSQVQTADFMGVSSDVVGKALRRLANSAAAGGWTPKHGLERTVLPGQVVKGVSTLYDSDGNKKAEWVKSKEGLDQESVLEALVEGITIGLAGVSAEPVEAPADDQVFEDLMTVYPMGDPHLGMYAWAAEAGEDFDTEIARRDLVTATKRLVACAPPSKTALIVNLGDFFHADGLDNRTARSGNALDVDTRMSKVWAIGIEAMVECIEAAKRRHQKVVVRNEIGNHDDHTSLMLSLALNQTYKDDHRVIIDTSPAKFFYYRFGKCLVGTTHGDTVRLPKLPGIMACDQSVAWGRTVHRYWYTGHFHSTKVEEYPGVVVEQFRTLAAKDAWTAGAGYRAGRDMRAIVLHKDHGEVERHRVDIGMLRAITSSAT